MRKVMLLAFVGLTGTVACTSLLGDFTLSGETSSAGNEAGNDAPISVVEAGADAEAATTTPTGTITVVATGATVYLGQVVALDASHSTSTSGGSLSFSWTVGLSPSGSQVSTSTLLGGSTATPRFVPDVLGTYKLVLSVTSGSDTAPAVEVDVTAVLAQVFYSQGTIDSDAGDAGDAGVTASAVYMVTNPTGADAQAVLCPDAITTRTTNEVALRSLESGRFFDFWEGPADTADASYKYAGFLLDYSDAGAYSTHLWTGTNGSSCAAPPFDLGNTNFGATTFGNQPHFSPDGSRFVVYDSQLNILTYPTDGSSAVHIVAGYAAGASVPIAFDVDPANENAAKTPPRVAWTATGGLAWARASATGWEVVEAPDQSNATVTQYMTCSGTTPRQIALLSDGAVIAAYRQPPGDGSAALPPLNLVQLQPTASAMSPCVLEQSYTTFAFGSAATASDFDVSPDGKTLAFLILDPSTQNASLWQSPDAGTSARTTPLSGGYVNTISIDNPASPQQVSADPALYGPRWIAGGSALAFTRIDGIAPGGFPATSVVVAPASGGTEQVVARGDGVTTFVSTSGSAGCSAGGGEAGAAGGAWLALVALVQCVRRRTRRAS